MSRSVVDWYRRGLERIPSLVFQTGRPSREDDYRHDVGPSVSDLVARPTNGLPGCVEDTSCPVHRCAQGRRGAAQAERLSIILPVCIQYRRSLVPSIILTRRFPSPLCPHNCSGNGVPLLLSRPPSWLPSKRPRGCRRTSAPFPHPPSPLCGRRRPKLLPFFIPFRRPRPTQGGRGGAGRGGSLAEARRLVGVWAAVRWASAQLWGEGNTAGRDGGRVKQEGAEASAGVGGGCHQSQLRGEHRVFPLARSADTRHADSTVPIVTVLFLHPKWTVRHGGAPSGLVTGAAPWSWRKGVHHGTTNQRERGSARTQPMNDRSRPARRWVPHPRGEVRWESSR